MTEREYEEMKADLEARRARREAGIEPEMWKAPEREEVRALPPTINVGRLVDGIHAHVEQRINDLASIIGEETGKAEKVLRKELQASATRVEELLRNEMRQGFGRHATELMRLRELREANQADLKLSLLDVRREVLELREALVELRGAKPRTLVTSGTGAHP